MQHSQEVINQGINISHKMLRMRARPKIILCHNYEDAWRNFKTYKETILGVISDVSFPRGGEEDAEAGIKLAKNIKRSYPDIPILLQSNDPAVNKVAENMGVSFLRKNSPRLLHMLKDFIKEHFGFGEFVFRLPKNGADVGRARNLRELEEKIRTVPDESIIFHARSNHFSKWLKARTEFYLAYRLRPQKVSDYRSTEDLRAGLISSLREYRAAQQRGKLVDYDPAIFDPDHLFTCFGNGSLGGKGRGLAFIGRLLDRSLELQKYEGIKISVPPSIIIRTDVFDDFIEKNNLDDFATNSDDDEEIVRRFVASELPDYLLEMLRNILSQICYPLAIRSSSLLEDSQFQPFAGVYDTFYTPNNHSDLEGRIVELASAIKRVYASTFLSRAKRYIQATPYRLEEEKMAVIIQEIVGIARNTQSISFNSQTYQTLWRAHRRSFTLSIFQILTPSKITIEG